MMVFKNWRRMLFTVLMLCLTTLRPMRTICVEDDSSRIKQVWEVIRTGTIKVTMILMLKLILSFNLSHAEEYLDWEMSIEQKFASHLVPNDHKVRQATSEFKDFAIIQWASLQQKLDSWKDLKHGMRDRFVPISYK